MIKLQKKRSLLTRPLSCTTLRRCLSSLLHLRRSTSMQLLRLRTSVSLPLRSPPTELDSTRLSTLESESQQQLPSRRRSQRFKTSSLTLRKHLSTRFALNLRSSESASLILLRRWKTLRSLTSLKSEDVSHRLPRDTKREWRRKKSSS